MKSWVDKHALIEQSCPIGGLRCPVRQPVDSCLLRWAFHCNRLWTAFLNRVSARPGRIFVVGRIYDAPETDPCLQDVLSALRGVNNQDVKLCVPENDDFIVVLSEYHRLLLDLRYLLFSAACNIQFPETFFWT